MEIYIDAQPIELYSNTGASIVIQGGGSSRIDNITVPMAEEISFPMTPRNRLVMGDVDQICAVERFNKTVHRARIEEQGCVIAQGRVVLSAIKTDGQKGMQYVCKIVPPDNHWAEMAGERLIGETEIDFECLLDGDLIKESWTWERPVRFLPVARANFEAQNVGSTLLPPSKVLTVADYHPFLHIRTLVEAIFSQSGYALESDFIRSPLFDSLYMSGKFHTRNTSTMKSTMDFYASRFGEKTTMGDRLGRVYANPNISYNTVGNIVHTANPFETLEGNTINGVYSNGGCLRVANNRLEFKPTREVLVAFELSIKYNTDHVIQSRTQIRCFDTIYLGEGDVRKFKVANKNVDRRAEFKQNRSYTLIVFEHAEVDRYIFEYDRIVNPQGNLLAISSNPFVTRTTSIKVPQGETAINPRLLVQNSQTGKYAAYTGDWALYDGYVAELGETEVEVTVMTKPEIVRPGSPKYFDLIYFGGGDQNMRFTMRKETAMRPVFLPVATHGSTLGFTDVAAHTVTQYELLSAIKQMFNLHFHTDTASRRVYIEPESDFSDNKKTVDWTRKTDHTQPITIEELGQELGRTVSLSYRSGDARTTEYNQSNNTSLGKWSFATESGYPEKSKMNMVNALFTPAVNLVGRYLDAPSATIVAVGDKNENDENSMNFLPKIVSFVGMKPLPQGQVWGWPSYESQMPVAAFHSPENNISLCFENRGGIEGLHRYYDSWLETRSGGKRITAYMNLTPQDVEQLSLFDNPMGDMRSKFRIDIHGQRVSVRLEKIENYEPRAGKATKCTFIKSN